MNPEPSFQLPAPMSTGAPEVDWLYYAIYWFSVLFTVAITVTMIYFVVKYRRRKGDRLEAPGHYTRLELFWTITPIFFIIVLFHLGFQGYIHNSIAAEDALEIRVRGRKWLWEFEYPNGMRETSNLKVPINRPVKLILSSDDVLHSFFIPAFRLKKDAVPGMYSSIPFEANVLGDAQVFCAEYCGTSHSGMLATIKVVTQEEFDKFLKEGDKKPDDLTPAQWGEKLFAKNACPTCHSRDGSASPGPTFKGVYGRRETLASGQSVEVDENYIRESILKPQAKVVQGYTNVIMPAFVLTDPQLDALIAYLKTIK
jgi:cytochrome c oxidase subunit 2